MVFRRVCWIFLPLLVVLIMITCNTGLESSGEKAIISFKVEAYSVTGNIDQQAKKITFHIPVGVNARVITPTITISEGADLHPPSGRVNDFTMPQSYTVTAEDGSTVDYTVTAVIDTNKALLIVDVQNIIFTWGIHAPDTLLANIRTLIDGAHQANCMVIYIQQTDDFRFIQYTEPWDIHPDIEPDVEDEVILKLESNAFSNTTLNGFLRQEEIGEIYVCGLVSNGCVEASCRGGHGFGYRILLVRDAHSIVLAEPRSLIDETNSELESEDVVELIYTDDVTF